MSIFTKIFGDPNEKVVKGLQPIVEEINAFEAELEECSDEDLQKKTEELKKRLAPRFRVGFVPPPDGAESGDEGQTLEEISAEGHAGGAGSSATLDDMASEDGTEGSESLDDLLPEAFALVREAAKRRLGQRHFDVQLIGGIVLHRGQIAEMRTGEGKTLTATLPLYLNALTGKGAHLVTVNDYLARLHGVQMGQIYHALGLSTGIIVHDQAFVYDPSYHIEQTHETGTDPEKNDPHDTERDTMGAFKIQQSYLRPVERREAYAADITYGTNNEFGFDYLRDNMVYEKERVAQHDHYFVIVDEIDSILIDEARTPLIISAPDTESSKLYEQFAHIVPRLKRDEDYKVDEKFRSVTLTEAGINKIEEIVGGGNLYEEGRVKELHALESSLRALALFQRDKEYVVKDGEIVIVDEFTGRLMPGRRYSEGLHQAIEAKEGVKVQQESRTLATITFQNFFRMYKKLAGMTGTAATNAEEFHKVYKLDVVTIPTNRPMVRRDMSDLVFKSEKGKFMAVAREVKARYEAGQPVLIGTVSIEKNEYLSELLKREGIPHEMLNAKNHEREGAIIAQAGRRGAVTVATNMAGRGVDIILGGNPPDPAEAANIKELGGLFVIGTERHEARRIDNQLRGRSGRQGDPGMSQFFVSLQDELMRIFGGDRIRGLMERLGVPEDEPIANRLISRSIEQAQGRIEGYNFDIRKHVLEYDEVMNKHREVIYKRRRDILADVENGSEGTKAIVMEMVVSQLQALMMRHVELIKQSLDDEDQRKELVKLFMEELGKHVPLSLEHAKAIVDQAEKGFPNPENLEEELVAYAKLTYEAKEGQLGASSLRQAEKAVLLQTLDMLWMDHLDNMEHLRDAVRLRAYGQRDPLIEYKHEGHRMFQGLLATYETMVAQTIFRVGPITKRGGEELRQIREEKRDIFGGDSPMKAESERHGGVASAPAKPEAGRNDLCPCGSGKKYKKCHGK
ncbi:MAG: preprotein translocase subunit SecA [bacterium]|nr:preprotein translocase subunit SecA [bacterium]